MEREKTSAEGNKSKKSYNFIKNLSIIKRQMMMTKNYKKKNTATKITFEKY